MLSYCIEWEWIEQKDNIVRQFMKSKSKSGLKESPSRRRYLSYEEEESLIENASDMVKNAIILSIETGLRDQELMSLQWSQINFDRSYITTTLETKSKRLRIVPLTQKSAQILKDLPRHITSPYVFYNTNGKGHIRRFVKGFLGAVKRAGIEDLRWHDLRRTAGCRWLQRDGLSIQEVSMLLGHSSISVTEKNYAFLNEEQTALKAVKKRQGTKRDTGQAV